MAVDGEKHERNPSLATRELPLANELFPMLDGHRAREVNPWYYQVGVPSVAQGSSKVAATCRQAAPHILPAGGDAMEKVINCPCGFVLKGGSDEEVVAKAQAHAKQVHQMDLSREQALAMAKPA